MNQILSSDPGGKVLWVKAFFNGILAWFFGFVLYMFPGIVRALIMGFRLGPKSEDPAQVSRHISRTISDMYQSAPWLIILWIGVIALFVFWRTRRITAQPGNAGIPNGLLVAAFPALLALLTLIFRGFELSTLLEIPVYGLAGFLGARK